MKKISILLSLGLMSSFTQSQILEENFDFGLNADWTQFSNESNQWIPYASFGINNSDCAIVDLGMGSDGSIVWLQTPQLDLSLYEDAKVTFSTALIQNNFVAPTITLSYNIGSGWEFLSRWGDNVNGDVMSENIIESSFSHSYPLDPEDIEWIQDLTYDLSSLLEFSDIRFAFGADISNGGFVLLDEVTISGTEKIDDLSIGKNEFETIIDIFPNPVSDVLTIQTLNENIVQVEIYDLSGGCVVKKENVNLFSVKLDLGGLKTGIYQAVIRSDSDKVEVRKINVI